MGEDVGVEYVVDEVAVGVLMKVRLPVVRMTRARFLRIVDRVLLDYPDLIVYIRPIAERMERFPFGAWVTRRGCGCLVGEYLMETDPRERQEFIRDYPSLDKDEIGSLLSDREMGRLATTFMGFGTEIDDVLEREVSSWTGKAGPPRVILIEN